MAANGGARRTLQHLFSSASTKTLLTSSCSSTAASFASKASNLSGTAATAARRLSLRRLASSRVRTELGGALSLMPLHSVTASALFTSLLSSSNQNWGCLSEGFATPL